MGYNLDLDEKDQEFSNVLAPDGVYDLKVKAYKEKTSSTGHPMISLAFEIIDEKKYSWIWYNLTFIPKGMDGKGILKHVLKCLGFDVTQNHFSGEGQDFIDRVCTAKVITGEWKGDKRNEIKQFIKNELQEKDGVVSGSDDTIPF